MEFGFGPDELAFGEDVRRFLRTHPPRDYPHDGMAAAYAAGYLAFLQMVSPVRAASLRAAHPWIEGKKG